MVVWGGLNISQSLDTGAQYDPLADTWIPTALTGAPSARGAHTAVWTGGFMVIWGGYPYPEYGTSRGGLYALGHAVDNDADGFSECAGDCNDGNAATYAGAPEINDGVDNQCPGDAGFGVIDETSNDSGFYNPDDKNEYSWPAQPGALGYEVARADLADFAVGCTIFGPMPQTLLIDVEPLPAGELRFYVNRSSSPNPGSWGHGSSGQERDVPCD